MSFELTVGERLTPLWAKLLAHATEQRDILRAKNDGFHDPVVTAALRAEINAWKKIIALDQDKPEIK